MLWSCTEWWCPRVRREEASPYNQSTQKDKNFSELKYEFRYGLCYALFVASVVCQNVARTWERIPILWISMDFDGFLYKIPSKFVQKSLGFHRISIRFHQNLSISIGFHQNFSSFYRIPSNIHRIPSSIYWKSIEFHQKSIKKYQNSSKIHQNIWFFKDY